MERMKKNFMQKGCTGPGSIEEECNRLMSLTIQGDLASAIAGNVLQYSPQDLSQMKLNFSEKIRGYDTDYQKHLKESITAFLDGTYQTIRLMNQQGSFSSMHGPVADHSREYWKMVVSVCSTGQGDPLRFLKYLLSGFCMLVQRIPGHPVGMEFPGGDRVDIIDGVYYCPVRSKANDVDAALCPFCPAIQTPEIGYLKPPLNATENKKQEFIKNCYDYHHFNG
jgi:uncharacterized protein (UPF0305 family)